MWRTPAPDGTDYVITRLGYTVHKGDRLLGEAVSLSEAKALVLADLPVEVRAAEVRERQARERRRSRQAIERRHRKRGHTNARPAGGTQV